ncbi:hypothetical protein A3K73_03260 [Candidatus Pacearchaeota archaeon RBG_13_36_9]|nr:MAG: hypothetical protein A3K73_03260 [Candidatus Pacearchaeota archaeon RBG_13_36_9]
MNKKGFEISFATIFSLIAGAAILFLALYFASRFIGSQQTRIDAESAAKLAVLMDPLETNMGESKSNILNFVTKTRIYNDRCSIDGNFGNQEIGIASSGFGDKWKNPTYGKKQYNKFIFSDEVEEGKEFYVFVKSFNLPFKVSDIFVLTAKKYCFISAPEVVKEELESLNPGNFNFTDSGCPKGSEKVCFSSSSGCDISVYGEYGYKQGYVSKDGEKMGYIGPLLYGAIFSSPEVYNCNVKRLKMRAVRLASVYQDEIKILERAGCSSQLDAPLTGLIALASADADLIVLQDAAEEIEIVNSASECRLFES